MTYDLANKRVYIAGHTGMVGRAMVNRLARESCEVVFPKVRIDLRDQVAVRAWLKEQKPDAMVVAAAKVGGILANDTYPGQFLYDNLMIEANLIEGARQNGVARLLFLGSSCIYPKFAEQPIKENALLTGPLEPTNEWYAIAKIAGIKLCQAYRKEYGLDYISAMPTNLYGPGDNFDLNTSHVLPALIRKAHEAKAMGARKIEIWGTGSPRREFLHVDDLADACTMLLKSYTGDEHVNVGSGEDVTIMELAEVVKGAIGFEGEIVTDITKPDGTPRKLMNSEKLRAMGWRPSISLTDGVAGTYEWFRANGLGATA